MTNKCLKYVIGQTKGISLKMRLIFIRTSWCQGQTDSFKKNPVGGAATLAQPPLGVAHASAFAHWRGWVGVGCACAAVPPTANIWTFSVWSWNHEARMKINIIFTRFFFFDNNIVQTFIHIPCHLFSISWPILTIKFVLFIPLLLQVPGRCTCRYDRLYQQMSTSVWKQIFTRVWNGW